MVGAVGAAARTVQRAGRTAGDHLRAAGAGPSRFQAAQAGARSVLRKQALQETRHFKKRRQTKHLQERVMRHLFTGLVAAVAVMAAAPTFACGYNPCGAPVYVAPAPVVDYGCNPCGGGGWAHERLAAPEQQYYYVNQGPTY